MPSGSKEVEIWREYLYILLELKLNDKGLEVSKHILRCKENDVITLLYQSDLYISLNQILDAKKNLIFIQNLLSVGSYLFYFFIFLFFIY